MNIERLFLLLLYLITLHRFQSGFGLHISFHFIFLSHETTIADKWRWNNKIIANPPWVQRRRLVHGEKTTHANQVKAGNKRKQQKQNRCVENTATTLLGRLKSTTKAIFSRRKAIKSELFTIKIRPFSMRLKNVISTM